MITALDNEGSLVDANFFECDAYLVKPPSCEQVTPLDASELARHL